MTFDATYATLLLWNKDLNDWALKHPAVCKLLAGGYENFQNRNTVHLNRLNERMKELYEENVRKDGNGNYLDLKDNEGQMINWDFKSSVHEAAFQQGWTELMDTKCQIIIGG